MLTKDFKNYKIESNEIDVTVWTDYKYKYDIDCYLNGLTYNGEIVKISPQITGNGTNLGHDVHFDLSNYKLSNFKRFFFSCFSYDSGIALTDETIATLYKNGGWTTQISYKNFNSIVTESVLTGKPIDYTPETSIDKLFEPLTSWDNVDSFTNIQNAFIATASEKMDVTEAERDIYNINTEIPKIYVDRLTYYIADHNCTGDTTDNGTEINLFSENAEYKKIIAGCSFEILDYDMANMDPNYDNHYIVDIYCPWLTDYYDSGIQIAVVNLNGGPLIHLLNLNDDPYISSDEFLTVIQESGGTRLLEPYNIDISSKTISFSVPAPETYTDMVWFENYKSVMENGKLDDTVAHLETLKEGTDLYAILFLVDM